MHWAPKNPGLHRQRPGFTHTSSSPQASGPSQMAEKHPPGSEGLGLDQGTLSPLTGSLTLKSSSLRAGCVCHRMDSTSSRAPEGKSGPQKGRKVTELCPPFSWGGGWSWLLTNGAFSILLPPAWAALEPSRGAVGQRGVSRRGFGKGGSLIPKVDHCFWLRCGRLPQPHQAGLAESQPTDPNPSPLLLWPSRHLS